MTPILHRGSSSTSLALNQLGGFELFTAAYNGLHNLSVYNGMRGTGGFGSENGACPRWLWPLMSENCWQNIHDWTLPCMNVCTEVMLSNFTLYFLFLPGFCLASILIAPYHCRQTCQLRPLPLLRRYKTHGTEAQAEKQWKKSRQGALTPPSYVPLI